MLGPIVVVDLEQVTLDSHYFGIILIVMVMKQTLVNVVEGKEISVITIRI